MFSPKGDELSGLILQILGTCSLKKNTKSGVGSI
jgi:hypothetical protein